MKCERCGQDLEPVWVGPGDRVRIEKEEWRVVCDMADLRGGGVMFEQPDKWAVWSKFMFKDAHITTLDGRPVAGFRDPAQEDLRIARERIADLEAAIANNDRDYSLVCEQRDSAEERIAELERTLTWANRKVEWGSERIAELGRKLQAAKITDEDIRWARDRWCDHYNGGSIAADAAWVLRDRIAKRVEETT